MRCRYFFQEKRKVTKKDDGTTEYPEQENAENGALPEETELVSEEVRKETVAPEVVTSVETAEEKQLPADGAVPPEQSAKKKRVKKILWNIFLVAIIAAGIIAMFGIVREIDPDESGSFTDAIKGVSPLFACLFVAVVLGIMLFDTCKYCIIQKTVTGRVHLSSSVKVNLLGRYYDAVTPFATGGQPMQIYYLNTKGNSGGNSSAIVLIRYVTSILSWIILGGALMIYGSVKGVLGGVKTGATTLQVCGWVGIGINLIIPVFVVLFLILPKFMYKLTNGLVKLGHKMKIVKDVEKTTARATKVVDDFKNSFKIMATTPLNFILLIFVSFAEAILTFSIPFFVMKAFSCNLDASMFLTVMSLNAFATFGASFIPTPGNSGVIEGMGAVAFWGVAAGPSVVWSVLFWRLGVYYIYIIIGISLTVADIIRKNVKARKEKKANAVKKD